MNSCGLILLAAGSSSRLGKPKQLLPYENKHLLQHSVEIALSSKAKPVVVVTGANQSLIEPLLNDLPIEKVHNTAWHSGIASSIRCGLTRLLSLQPAIGNVIFMVCDQPFVTPALLNNFFQKADSKACIAACSYEDILGTPALFNKKYFTDLLQLQGHEGAKKVINKYIGEVKTIPFPMGYIDIDTQQDYDRLSAGILDKF